MQQLTRHVQGQVARVHNAFDEAEVLRQELLRVVHDEDASHIEFQTLRGIPLPQVERRTSGDVQKARIFAFTLDLVMAPGERVGEVMGQVLIELLVFLVLDLGTGQRPKGFRLVHRLVFERGFAFLRIRTGKPIWSE